MDELQELKDKIVLIKEKYENRIKTGKEMISELEKEKPKTSIIISSIYRIKAQMASSRNILNELNNLTKD